MEMRNAITPEDKETEFLPAKKRFRRLKWPLPVQAFIVCIWGQLKSKMPYLRPIYVFCEPLWRPRFLPGRERNIMQLSLFLPIKTCWAILRNREIPYPRMTCPRPKL